MRVELEIDTKNKNHLESLLNESTEQSLLFLPLDLKSEEGEKGMWFNRKWWLLESGLMGLAPKTIFPQDHYDAFFLKDERPPHYFTRNENEEGELLIDPTIFTCGSPKRENKVLDCRNFV